MAMESGVPTTVEERVAAVVELVNAARPMPLSSSVVVNREEIIAGLNRIFEDLPEEIRAARWLAKERDEFLEAARSEADAIVAQGARQAELMVQRTEVTRMAQSRAARTVADAEAEARRHRRETEDWCEARLAQFDVTLSKVTLAVQEGRARLRELPRADPSNDSGEVVDLTHDSNRVEVGARGLFDQDEY
jgi:hypothetical protein